MRAVGLRVLLVCTVALLLALSLPAFAMLAFPGAEGYGKNTVGGRGGTVIQVTNLNDTGTGSLRAALTASGARTVVFRVAGIIQLASDIVISNPYLTVAGQTAPGDGICVKFSSSGTGNEGIKITTHDVIIRYLRVRCGFSKVQMGYGSPFFVNGSNTYNIIFDHCSSSWHPARTGVTVWPNSTGYSAHDITIQRHLAAEALLGGNHPGAARGAFLFGNNTNNTINNITLLKSLMVHSRKRHPEAKNCNQSAIATYQVINNVMDHFDIDGSLIEGDDSASNYHVPEVEVAHYNIFGNYYKRSLISDQYHSELCITPGVRVYAGDYTYGNIGPNRSSSSQDPWDIVSFINWDCPNPCTELLHAPKTPYQVTSPFDSGNLPPYVTADAAYTDVLNDVGANMGLNADGTFRNESDSVDVRVINDVINDTGNFINDPSDVGGWPTYGSGSGAYPDTDADGMSDTWETAKFGNLSRNGTGDYDGDGYTDLEEFLNGTEPAAPGPPVADFSGTPTTGAPPLTVYFTDLTTGSPTSWSWTFGDGGTSTAQNPSHQYTTANTSTVSLTATNAQGSDSETKNNYITVVQAQDYFCASLTVDYGTLKSGDHTSVHASDNVYLVAAAAKRYGKYTEQVTYTYNTGLGSLSYLQVTVEGKVSTGTQPQEVSVYNYSTSAWDQVSSSTLTTSDSTVTPTASNPSPYISGGTVKVRVHTGWVGGSAYDHSTDYVKITATP